MLRVEKLIKKYRNRTVVDGVSLQIDEGEIVGLLGPNGAGKTTTFRMTLGLIDPDGGDVFLGDTKITRLPMYKRARKGISYLPQETSIFQRLTVAENILAILETIRLPRRERRRRLEHLLGELELAHLRDSKAANLSGGEKRRLEITRALVIEPRFILLDEPFAGIDPIVVAEIQQILTRLREKGIGILLTDHSVRETLQVTDRSYIINQGRIFAHGKPEDLVKDKETRRVYLGETFAMAPELQVREKDVTRVMTPFETGVAQWRVGHYRNARDSFDLAAMTAEDDGEAASARRALAAAHLALGETQDAHREALAALDVEPDEGLNYLFCALALHAIGDHDEAVNSLKIARELDDSITFDLPADRTPVAPSSIPDPAPTVARD